MVRFPSISNRLEGKTNRLAGDNATDVKYQQLVCSLNDHVSSSINRSAEACFLLGLVLSVGHLLFSPNHVRDWVSWGLRVFIALLMIGLKD